MAKQKMILSRSRFQLLFVYSSLINPTDELVCRFALLNRRRRTEVVVVVVWAKRILSLFFFQLPFRLCDVRVR